MAVVMTKWVIFHDVVVVVVKVVVVVMTVVVVSQCISSADT